MSGFETQIAALRAAGKSATSAGEQSGGIDLVGGLTGVVNGLPGSFSAQAAKGAADRWAAAIREWSRAVTEFGGNLATAADRYAANEVDAKNDLQGVADRCGFLRGA
ncbi:hypothetical protein [Amycolatopsis thailandensis]|uniref:hypothetical protein n=1 Tax=Amycolatopsis thailandensis TaxID=589330 RepID=UPI00362E1135